MIHAGLAILRLVSLFFEREGPSPPSPRSSCIIKISQPLQSAAGQGHSSPRGPRHGATAGSLGCGDWVKSLWDDELTLPFCLF